MIGIEMSSHCHEFCPRAVGNEMTVDGGVWQLVSLASWIGPETRSANDPFSILLYFIYYFYYFLMEGELYQKAYFAGRP